MRHYLDLSLNELIEYNKKNKYLLDSEKQDPAHFVFAQIYEDFLLGNTEKLKQYQENVSQINSSGLKNNYDLKLLIREGRFQQAPMNELISAYQSEKDFYFKAEMAFSIARIFENKEDWPQSSDWYEKSEIEFASLGCHFKSQKCRLNNLCSLYNVNQDYKLVYKYEILLQQTLDLKNYDVAAMVANNISRLYLARNANQTALKFNTQALEYAPMTTLLNQHFIKLHQVKILFAVGDMAQSAQLVEELSLSPFPQVVNSLNLLRQHQQQINSKIALPESDHVSLPKEFKLSKSEGQIYDLLIQKKVVGLDEVITTLFGDKIDRESAMNRLGNLLFRVRKKTNMRIEIKDQEVVLFN